MSSYCFNSFFFGVCNCVDGGGVASWIAVEVPLPYSVSQTTGPCMQEVVHKYAYSSGLTQRTRIIINDPTVHVIHDGGRLPSDRELGQGRHNQSPRKFVGRRARRRSTISRLELAHSIFAEELPTGENYDSPEDDDDSDFLTGMQQGPTTKDSDTHKNI